MAFVYMFLIGALFFSYGGEAKPSNRVWILALISFFLTITLLIYHALSPLEIEI